MVDKGNLMCVIWCSELFSKNKKKKMQEVQKTRKS